MTHDSTTRNPASIPPAKIDHVIKQVPIDLLSVDTMKIGLEEGLGALKDQIRLCRYNHEALFVMGKVQEPYDADYRKAIAWILASNWPYKVGMSVNFDDLCADPWRLGGSVNTSFAVGMYAAAETLITGFAMVRAMQPSTMREVAECLNAVFIPIQERVQERYDAAMQHLVDQHVFLRGRRFKPTFCDPYDESSVLYITMLDE